MASLHSYMLVFTLLLFSGIATGQLSNNKKFYKRACPNLHAIIKSVMSQAVRKEPRMAASILRLHFHDCFVNGCDGSVLLDDTSTFTSEKKAFPNINSVRGFEVIDAIKNRMGTSCRNSVSCADILALAAREGVMLVGGPRYNAQLGRRDARTASQNAANANLPPPFLNLSSLISAFAAKGLSARDMTALSGSHTIGQAQCTNFRTRIYNESNINPAFAGKRRQTCPLNGGNANLAPLEELSPNQFDNGYFKDLVARRGVLHSDQELFNGGSTDRLVRIYSRNNRIFKTDFATGMIKMGAISPLTGKNGEIRRNCRKPN